MMPRYPLKFAFTPARNERVEAVVTAPRQQCTIVHGTVYDMEGSRVREAVVRLFVCTDEKQEPVADTLTDDDGEFVFGPIEAERSYVIKVYAGGVTLREVTVRPRKKRVKAPK